ncbi:MAG: response regulator transcription factor [Chthoniobacterales bacterium]
MRLLIADDEKKIARFLRKRFVEEGFSVDVVHTGNLALEHLTSIPYDAAILDIMMPDRDGLSVLRSLRESKNTTPILLLSARGETAERIEGLNLGADDYLAKPFSMDELVARLRALLRRSSGETLSFYKIADLAIHLAQRKVLRGERKIELTPREFAVLEFLARSPGRVITRTQICEKVWDYHFDPGTNLVDVYIQRLRRKIDDGESVPLIHTVRGVGYLIQADKP